MKKVHNALFALLLLVFTSGTLHAQVGGKVYDNLNLKSSKLNKEVNYALYLPPDYGSSERSYPVLYLLHGYSDNHTGWLQFGEVKSIADKAIASGKVTPMIIVMPDAGVSWYMNNQKGNVPYEDFFVKELIPHIESNYKCRTKKEFRAVAGLSMGGYGSLLYALKYPELFTACCPLSAAVFTDEEITNMATSADSRNDLINNLFGDKERDLNKYWKKNSILQLVKDMPENQKRAVRFYVDCGDDDFLYKGNAALHVTMREANVPHEFRMRDGGHTWSYWRSALPKVLQFVSDSFHR